MAGLGIGAVIVGVWWVSGRLGHLAEHPLTLEEAFLATNSRRMESLSFVAPVAYTMDWLILFSDTSRVLTLGIVSLFGVVLGSGAVALASGSFRWEGFRDTEDTANHLVGAALMGIGGVTAMGCTIGPGLERREHAGAGQLRGAGRHPGRWLARCCATRPGAWSAAFERSPTARPTWSAVSARCGGCTATRATRQVRAARVAVVGLGGVGSWAAEALARSGVAALVLIDLDHVAESNINRQVQALGATLGQAKVVALRERVADIHPGCAVSAVEEFVDAANWPALLPHDVDAVIDACDQVRAKAALAAWALAGARAFVGVGAAGGKRLAQAVEVADLALVTHDPLLASLRQRLRREHGAARQGHIGLRCVYSREAVLAPDAGGDASAAQGGAALSCQGYGSLVTVTATFGMVAAGEVIAQLLPRDGR